MINVIHKFTAMRQRPKQAMLFLLLMMAGQQAYAQCRVNTTRPQDIIMNVGRVLITPNTKVGDILATGKFDIRRDDNISCSGNSTLYGRILQGGPSSISDKIWTTNVPGVGLRLYRQIGSQEGAYYPHEIYRNGGVYLAEGYFVVEVIKIAQNTGTGSLAPGQYSSYYADGTGPSRPILISHVLANSITIVTSSCSVDAGSKNKVINLSTVATAAFKGVGSTAAEQDFSININCVGGSGTELLPGGTGEGLVNVRFDYTRDASNAPGVLQPVQDSNAASGVGVQLLTGNNSTPITSGTAVYAGHTIANQTNTITLPLKARYYQTAAKMKGGTIKSIATFTLEYN
ncbi:fimbrial protein [Serratia fonticola]|uniref:fimbrial protein n=1 Tax=Serratia fonticola TaxID=47917 RepID=UPI00192BB94D|nr:fimbrial protein [Serratia fonticola]MBL5824726.1 fimbrial protein [Serratia fonticola]